jgi:hypothetical protein
VGVDPPPIPTTFSSPKILWGNVPAYDVLKLDRDEGMDYRQDLGLCFVASGDLRNVISSMVCLPVIFPENYTCRERYGSGRYDGKRAQCDSVNESTRGSAFARPALLVSHRPPRPLFDASLT